MEMMQKISVMETGIAVMIMVDFSESSGALANIRHSGIAAMMTAQKSFRLLGGISSVFRLVTEADKVKLSGQL